MDYRTSRHETKASGHPTCGRCAIRGTTDLGPTLHVLLTVADRCRSYYVSFGLNSGLIFLLAPFPPCVAFFVLLGTARLSHVSVASSRMFSASATSQRSPHSVVVLSSCLDRLLFFIATSLPSFHGIPWHSMAFRRILNVK